MTAMKIRATTKRWVPHLAAGILLSALLVLDEKIYAAFSGFRSPFLDWLTDRVSQLRGATFPAAVALLLVFAGLLARRRKIRRAGLAMLLTALLAGTVTSVMKEVIGRQGPEVNHIAGMSWLKARYGRFPSSHSAIMFSPAHTLAQFAPAAAVPGYTLAAPVRHERIYRGAHWPSDIFAGLWIGLVIARYVRYLIAKTSWGEDLAPVRPKRAAETAPALSESFGSAPRRG